MPPPQMLLDIAMGLEDPASIAFRYGYETDDYAWLANQNWFIQAIEQRKSELKTSGWTYRAKMALLAEEAGLEVYRRFKSTESLALQVDIWKYLNKLADLEPKAASAQVAPGAGFSITINLGDKPQPTPVVIEQTDLLPPAPAYVRQMPLESLSLMD